MKIVLIKVEENKTMHDLCEKGTRSREERSGWRVTGENNGESETN